MDSRLEPIYRYVVAKRWEKHPGFSVKVTDLESDGKPEILVLTDRAILLGLEGR